MTTILGAIDGVMSALCLVAGVASYLVYEEFEPAVILLLLAIYFSIYAVRFAIGKDMQVE